VRFLASLQGAPRSRTIRLELKLLFSYRKYNRRVSAGQVQLKRIRGIRSCTYKNLHNRHCPNTNRWTFRKRSISVPSAVRVAARFLESHAKTQRKKTKTKGSFGRSTTRNGLPLWSLCLCGSKRLLGCFISGQSASISGPGLCPGSSSLTQRRKDAKGKGKRKGSLARYTTRNRLPLWSLCLCGSKRLLGSFNA
jgi:hypothetical protein